MKRRWISDKLLFALVLGVVCVLSDSVWAVNSSVLINEIMYHPYHEAGQPEDLRAEFIELVNPGKKPVDLTGWSLSRGVAFDFPPMTLAPKAYIVVAADVAMFRTLHPEAAAVTGNWVGHLSNSGEALELTDASGRVVNRVDYADQGDWSQRELGPDDYGHRGWQWRNDHDGQGKSLELINADVSNACGQNWAASLEDGGTPGRPNSVAVSDIAPMIQEVGHWPLVPGPDDQVIVNATIMDELPGGVRVFVQYRVDQSGSGEFQAVELLDDGLSQDALPGDRIYGAMLPAQPEGSIVEFFIEAHDVKDQTRSWPAPVWVDGEVQQSANALYQVDSIFDVNQVWQPGTQPLYRLIMTEAECADLAKMGSNSTEGNSRAQKNGTFISVDGVSMACRYGVGIRNRGAGSRSNNSNNYRNNYRVNFLDDAPWQGVTALNIKNRYGYIQTLGAALWRKAGLAAADTYRIQVRVNGENLAQTNDHMYGSYVAVEVTDSEFASHQFPQDAQGNVYRTLNNRSDLGYEGPDPASYRSRYQKMTNTSAEDFNDLVLLTDTLNNTPAEFYPDQVKGVIDVNEWLRFLAVDTLAGNREGGLNTPKGDDYAMYRGLIDTRFKLIPYDLDTLFGFGGTGRDINRDIFRYAGLDGLHELLNHPDIQRLYYQHLIELIHTVFSPEQFDPLVDRALGGWVPDAVLTQIKAFVVLRNAAVLDQIPLAFRQEIMPPTLLTALNPPAQYPTNPGQPPLRINEIWAGHHAFEVYWEGPDSVDLAGMSLKKDPNGPVAFQFVTGTIMQAGEIRFWSNQDGPDLTLDAGGDALYLYDVQGQCLDQVTFGPQLTDLSIGRVGAQGAWTLTVPTLGLTNVAQPQGDALGLKINEWFADGFLLLDRDFVELYNPGSLPVDAGGLYLTDTLQALNETDRVQPLSFVPPLGCMALTADGRNRPGHVPFKLSPQVECLALLDSRSRVIDSVVYGPQTTDVAQGRLPDGAETVAFLTLPTPGMTNPKDPTQTLTTHLVLIDQAWAYTQTEPSGNGLWSQPDYDDSAWSSGPALLYVEGSSLPAPKNTPLTLGPLTSYFRTHFQVTGQPDTMVSLTLSTVIDDGAIVYLNGHEILRLRMPDGQATGTTLAKGSVGNAVYEGPFDVPLADLVPGDNCLAVEVHQTSAGSSDIVFGLSLDGTTVQASDSHDLDPVRPLLNGLRITELMYHAPAGGASDYIELKNVTDSPLDLTGVRLTDGVGFVFSAYVLDPGAVVVVVKDRIAFESQYGLDLPVAGEYTGNLSNQGERLVLTLPSPWQVAIQRFEYQGTWYPSADGGGQSLVVADPSVSPYRWSSQDTWVASEPTPGAP